MRILVCYRYTQDTHHKPIVTGNGFFDVDRLTQAELEKVCNKILTDAAYYGVSPDHNGVLLTMVVPLESDERVIE